MIPSSDYGHLWWRKPVIERRYRKQCELTLVVLINLKQIRAYMFVVVVSIYFDISVIRHGILRDNLPPTLAADTSKEELTQIADSVEDKLYNSASTPQEYKCIGTLESRIKALATAELSDKVKGNGDKRSEMCARLTTAAQKSMVHCVMVLVNYEKKRSASSRKRVSSSSASLSLSSTNRRSLSSSER